VALEQNIRNLLGGGRHLPLRDRLSRDERDLIAAVAHRRPREPGLRRADRHEDHIILVNIAGAGTLLHHADNTKRQVVDPDGLPDRINSHPEKIGCGRNAQHGHPRTGQDIRILDEAPVLRIPLVHILVDRRYAGNVHRNVVTPDGHNRKDIVLRSHAHHAGRQQRVSQRIGVIQRQRLDVARPPTRRRG